MRSRKTMAGMIALAIMGSLAVLLWPSSIRRSPPVLTLFGVEHVRIVDDTGAEMWLAYVSISNASPVTATSKGLLFVKDRETRAGNRWLEVSELAPHMLRPGAVDEWPLLFSAHAGAGQLRFKYTGASRLFGGESWRGPWRRLMQRLPRSVQVRLSKDPWFAFA